MLGQKVTTLLSEKQAPGNHQVVWDASSVASGVYLYRVTAMSKKGNFVHTKKLVVLK
jgi:hypothetical protein